MSNTAIKDIAAKAANIQIASPGIKLFGNNIYVLNTNSISWGQGNTYAISDIASTFGDRNDARGKVIAGGLDYCFTCGNDTISAFDLGLLYNTFCMIVDAVARKSNFVNCLDNIEVISDKDKYNSIWIDGNCMVYSMRSMLCLDENFIVRIINSRGSVQVKDFCTGQDFSCSVNSVTKALEFVSNSNRIFVSMPKYMQQVLESLQNNVNDDPFTVWDESSPLGKLIMKSEETGTFSDIAKAYANMDSTKYDENNSLIIKSGLKVENISDLFGRICLNDKSEPVLAVNFRDGLFTYVPWFSENNDESSDGEVPLQTVVIPNIRNFSDITDGCSKIMKFAESINDTLLDKMQAYNKFQIINEAFINMKLTRIPVNSIFGRLVVPEEVLLEALKNKSDDNLLCFLPVGILGNRFIHKTTFGMSSIAPINWGINSYFYDVTEVL